MAVNNYANLKTSVARLVPMAKADDIDDAIDLVEADLFKRLRLRTMEKTAYSTLDTTDRYHPLPDNFQDMRRLTVNYSGDEVEIFFATPASLKIISTSGVPRFFTTTDRLEFDRVPSSALTVEMIYLEKPTALSAGNTTNVILSEYPNLYLYGACMHAFVMTRNNEDAAFYSNVYEDEVAKALRAERKSRYGAVPAVRTEGPTP